jgi:hypothetical protein
VRTEGDPAAAPGAIRDVVRDLDPSLPLYRIRPLADIVAQASARRSFTFLLVGGASGVALFLGAIGLYGVMSYVVTLRTREMGIRLAIGAAPDKLCRMVLRQGLAVATLGIAVGLAGAMALTRFLAALLFEVSPTDPAVLAVAAALLLVVAVAASWIPARRAAVVDVAPRSGPRGAAIWAASRHAYPCHGSCGSPFEPCSERARHLLAALTLALGIGASTAILSVTKGVLLDPLPYRDPDRLALIWAEMPRSGFVRYPISGPELEDLRARSKSFEEFASSWTTTGALVDEEEPQTVRLARVTWNFPAMLGAEPILGRSFGPEEERPAVGQSVLLSEELWRRRFGGDPSILGRDVRIDGGDRRRSIP